MSAPEPTPVAYLATLYPALSQQFVRREVEALRTAGLPVRTVAVRPSPPANVLSVADQAAQATTTVLLDGQWAALLREVATLFARRPRAFVSTLRYALTSGGAGVRAKVWQSFYFVEAVRLVARLRGSGVRHIHVHFANNAADVARLASHLATGINPGRPMTWSLSMHGPTEFMEVTRFDLAAKVRSASFVACISDYARSQLMTLVEPIHWPKLHIVHMGVEVAAFPSAAAARAARADGPLRVLFVGRLVPEKGVPILLDAVAELVRRDLAIAVTVIGDSPARASLEAEVKARGLSDVVRFEGAVGPDDLRGWYEWADVFCLPSFAEGVPVVLMEAMATELPVVTTTIAGIPELVKDDVNGLLVPPGRSELIADAIARLTSPALRVRLGAAGRQSVLTDFDASTAAAHLLPLFAATNPDAVATGHRP